MNKLPSIISTYSDTFKLFAKSFIPILPFTLLLVIAEHFYNDYQQQFIAAIQHGQQVDYKIMFAVYASYYIVYTLLFSIALYGLAQFKNENAFNYPQALEKGAARTPSALLAMVILAGPMILLIVGLFFSVGVTSGFGSGVMLLAGIAFIILFIYFYVASALIIVRDHSAVKGLGRSFEITKGHWWKTFIILAILCILAGLITLGLQKFTPDYADEIVMIFIFPLSCTLMFTHMENLERAYQALPTAVVTDKK